MTRCQICEAPVQWKSTPSGLRIPVDPAPHPEGPLCIEPGTGAVRIIPTADRASFTGPRYTSHWITCPACREDVP